MNLEQATERHNELADELRRHDHAYYVLAAPVISDREYDRLYRDLVDLEERFPELRTPDSPTQRVGGEPLKEFEPVEHLAPMMSLDNTYSQGEVRSFILRAERLLKAETCRWIVEPKVDGVAVNLRYEHGKLAVGTTRGDGSTGDNVTANLRTIRSLPTQLRFANKAKRETAHLFETPAAQPLPETLEIRGEVFFPRAAFQKLNELRKKEGDEPFANPRNAAAGSLKQLDSKLVAKRPLDVLLYGFGHIAGAGKYPEEHHEVLEWLAEAGFRTPERTWLCSTVEEILAALDELEKVRREFSYDTDGAVIKLNSYRQREQVGYTSKAPRWAIAYKFAAEQAETQLREITIQVGRTGALTPVAELEPVLLAGSTISRATLHNADELRRKDIRLGDVVTIEKAGEVIPAVVGVVLSKRTGQETVFHFPTTCPDCGGPVTRAPLHGGGDESVVLRCVNFNCPAQIRGRIEHWCSRGAMDIEGAGESVVDQLVKQGLARDVAALYQLTEERVEELERMGKKSAQNLVRGISESKKRDLWRLIFGLGILHVGAGVAKTLARHFSSLDDLMNAGEQELNSIPEIGPAIAKSVTVWFSNKENQALISRLREAGLNFNSLLYEEGAAGRLSGKIFVLTGTLPNLKREEAAAKIEALGGRVSSSVSKKTDYVVAGEDPGSKMQKAQKLAIPILDEEGFLQLLADSAALAE